MADYSRPASGYRFVNGGMKTNAPADGLPENKYPYLENVRGTDDNAIQSRPPIAQYGQPPAGSSGPVPPFGATITALEPTIGVYKFGRNILAINPSGPATPVDTGYSGAQGASIIPFRPNQSPNAYDYIFDAIKQSKVYIPPSGSPVVNKIGGEEPQTPCDAAISRQLGSDIQVQASGYTHGGSGGVLENFSRITDTVSGVFQDPASSGFPYALWSVSTDNTGNLQTYTRHMQVVIGTGSPSASGYTVTDVFPASQVQFGIASILYYAGNTGRCVIVPLNMSQGPGTEGQSLYTQNLLNSLRRGSVIEFYPPAGGDPSFPGYEECFVLSVTEGPDGTVCFETSTTLTHTAVEVFQCLSTIQVSGGGTGLVGGALITSPTMGAAANPGIATFTSNFTLPQLFVSNYFSSQPEDYIHISLNIAALASLIEAKFLIDVGDGSFTQNFYFFTIRASDIQGATQNILTQLGAAELVSQRAAIDEEKSAASHNQLRTSSSAQTTPGDGQWAEVFFPISALTRVGNDQTKTLQNATKVQFLFNLSAATDIYIGQCDVFGGFQPDVGDTGIPYLYWKRARSSVTGAVSNPSPIMRYGVSPRRQQVTVTPGTSYPDPQMDTWDLFRQGGSLTKKRYLGSIPISAGQFIDNYSDDAIENNDEMDGSNFEPFPSIGPPITAVDAAVSGTALNVTFPSAAAGPAAAGTLTQIGNLLPGNLINVGQKVFTLWTRPNITVIALDGTQHWLLQLVENAGYQVNPMVSIAEPALANQPHPYVWGPDANGILFSVGDPLRPGVLSRTNPQNPDSCDEKNADELCPPTEPLQNGALLGGVSVVASPDRWWAGYPQQNTAIPYRWVEIPVGRGLAAPFGICSDGKHVYFWAKDGIYRHALGVAKSLTDDDLFNLFPHEGVNTPQNFVYAGKTVYPPSYSLASSFRLAVANNFLFADYTDSSLVPRTLVLDLRTMAWSIDTYTPSVRIHAVPTLPGASSSGTVNQQLFMGCSDGSIQVEGGTATESVGWAVATRADTMGDIRAQKQFGDASLDVLPAGGGVTATPILDGVLFSTPTTVPQSSTRATDIINLLGEQLATSLGLLISGTDTTGAYVQTRLYSWQPSYIVKPEDTENRVSDWTDAGVPGAKFFQGFLLKADTNNVSKQLAIRNADTQTVQQVFNIIHNGEQEIAYSFGVPFVAHLVREEPDLVPWKRYSLKWIFQPTPEFVGQWITQPTSHGLLGFQHVKEARFSYNSENPFLFTITIDGTSYRYIIPGNRGNIWVRFTIPFGPWKGRVFQYGAAAERSGDKFQISQELVLLVKPWGDTGPYREVTLIGGQLGPEARI